MRKLHVRLALMLTVTFECLKTEFCRRSTWSGWKTGTFNSRVLLPLFILRPVRQDYFTPCGRFGRLLVASLQITNVLLIKKYPPAPKSFVVGGILDQNGISWNHKSGSTASMPSLGGRGGVYPPPAPNPSSWGGYFLMSRTFVICKDATSSLPNLPQGVK